MHFAIDASRATRARQTGTEHYARQVIERLVTRPNDHRWTLFFQDDPGEWLGGLPQVERIVLPRPRLWTYAALAPALLRLRPDAFWEPAHVLPPTAPMAGIQSLVTVHDLGYEHFPEAHLAAHRLYLQATTRYHSLAATHIAADSAATRDDLIRWYGTDARKISVVHLGVDHELFRPVADRSELARVRAQYGTGEHFLLYMGTIQPRKNLSRLVRAFGSLVEDYPDLRLVLAGGEGWLADELQSQIDQVGLRERVVRPGYVKREDMPALLSAAYALAFPSLFEGFGLPVLEAMACGTPVLTSLTSSLPEVAGDAAILVDPASERQIADGLRLLLSQPALRAALSERGLERAQSFTWERTADQIMSLLEAIGATPDASPAQAGPNARRQERPIGLADSSEMVTGYGAVAREAIPIFGLPIHNISWEETLAEISAMIESRVPHQIVTANPEFMMRARVEPRFMDVLRRADLVLADGIGLLLAARFQGRRFKARVTGSDLTPLLAAEAAKRSWRLYLLGAAPGVGEEAARRLRAQYPTLNVIADASDPEPDGPPNLIERIRVAAPDILLVAYGAPKQDFWIDGFGRQTGVPVQIGIGGALDFIAEVVPRAPERWQQLGLEWLWRLKEEPWRWRRMTALPRFALLTARDALRDRIWPVSSAAQQ